MVQQKGITFARVASVVAVLALSVMLAPTPAPCAPRKAAGSSATFHEAGDWPCIHHDSVNSDVLPEGKSAPMQFEFDWSALVNASALSSPVIGDNGRIYVTATKENFLADGRDDSSGLLESRLYALDASDGHTIWKVRAVREAGMACAPLLLRDPSGRMNVVVSCKGKVVSYIDRGRYAQKLWESGLNPDEFAISCHLFPDGASILVGTNKGGVYLKDAASGSNVLEPYRREGFTNTNTPAVTGDGTVILVGRHNNYSGDGVAWAVRPTLTGSEWEWDELWKFDDIDGASQTSPTVAASGDRVYVGDGYGDLIALTLVDTAEHRRGEEIWRYEFDDDPALAGYLIYASVSATPDGLIGLELAPRRWDPDLPMYVGILEDTGVDANRLYFEDHRATSGVAYSVETDSFYFTGGVPGPGGTLEDKLFRLDWSNWPESVSTYSQPIENPSLNNISLGDGIVIVPIFWGGVGKTPPVTSSGFGVHCYRQATQKD